MLRKSVISFWDMIDFFFSIQVVLSSTNFVISFLGISIKSENGLPRVDNIDALNSDNVHLIRYVTGSMFHIWRSRCTAVSVSYLPMPLHLCRWSLCYRVYVSHLTFALHGCVCLVPADAASLVQMIFMLQGLCFTSDARAARLCLSRTCRCRFTCADDLYIHACVYFNGLCLYVGSFGELSCSFVLKLIIEID